MRFELEEDGVSGGPGGGGGLRLPVVVVGVVGSGEAGTGDGEDCLDMRSETFRKTLRFDGGSVVIVQSLNKMQR